MPYSARAFSAALKTFLAQLAVQWRKPLPLRRSRLVSESSDRLVRVGPRQPQVRFLHTAVAGLAVATVGPGEIMSSILGGPPHHGLLAVLTAIGSLAAGICSLVLGLISAIATLTILSALRQVVIDRIDAERGLGLPVLLTVTLSTGRRGRQSNQPGMQEGRRS